MAPKTHVGQKPLSLSTNSVNMDGLPPRPPSPMTPKQLAQYNEEQQYEYEVLQSIYQDNFHKIPGKAAAWQKHKNLAYSILLNAPDDTDIFTKLEVELPKDYPKIEPVIRVAEIQSSNDHTLVEVLKVLNEYPKTKPGQVIIWDICDAIVKVLADDADVRADKGPVMTLEEERLAQQMAALEIEEAEMQQLGHRGTGQKPESVDLTSSQPRGPGPSKSPSRKLRRISDIPASTIVNPGLVTFSQPMTAQDILTKDEFVFTHVTGNTVLLEREDKTVKIVTPVASTNISVPQLVLKDIRLPENKSETIQMRDTMRDVEDLLEQTKKHRNMNVVDVLGYSVRRNPVPTTEESPVCAFWELAILTEWSRQGSLKEHLSVTGVLSAAKIRSWSRQLLQALEFFEKNGYVHPAVHEGNILIFLSPNGEVTVKLSDGYGTVLRGLVNQAKPASAKTSIETPLWEPPELARNNGHRSAKTCIWDLGVVMLKMATGLGVADEFTSPSDCIKNSVFITGFRDLLEHMFVERVDLRPRAFDLSNMGFFRDDSSSVFDFQNALALTPSRRRRQSTGQPQSSYDRYESEWEEVCMLGKGGQAKVFKARNKLDGEYYAIKKFVCHSRKELDGVFSEVKMLSRVNHNLIVRYFTSWDEKEYSRIDDTDSASDAPNYDVEDDTSHLPSTGFDLHANTSGLDLIGFEDSDDLSGSNPFGTDSDNDLAEGSEVHHLSKPHKAFGSSRSTEPEKITLYIQMELCENKTLRQHLKFLCEDPKEGWRIFRQIVDGLAYIHGKGIVHRDLKPDNIFLGEANTVRIGDFGLATTGHIATSERPLMKSFASKYTYDIGTPGYIAPELKKPGVHAYSVKADIFSLGIVFFEMCFEMSTQSERIRLLNDLSEPLPELPAKFSLDEWSTQGELILKMVSYSQEARPTASQLLQGNKVRQPITEEELQDYLQSLQTENPDKYAAVIDPYFKTSVSTELKGKWLKSAEDLPSLRAKALSVYVRNTLETVFRQHGAVLTNRQNVFPKFEQYSEDAATFLDKSGVVVQLPYDLTLPFAREIAKQKPDYQKSYAIGSVFRKDKRRKQPVRRTEACFDFVSDGTLDLSAKEAETIKVVDECIASFPQLQTRSMMVYLNHVDLLRIILNFCRIKPEQHEDVIRELSQLYTPACDWQKIHKRLRSDKINIMETSLTTLQRFDFQADQEEATAKMLQIFEDDPRLGRVGQLLTRLGQVTSCLARLKLNSRVYISPLSNRSEPLYRGYLMFQYIDESTGSALAVGGRYDDLVKEFQPNPGQPKVRAVGFRLNVAEVTELIMLEIKSKLGARMAKGDATEILIAEMPRRCDVLITSFDYALYSTICLDVIQDLWANGITSELTDYFRNLAELEQTYRRESYCWVVVIRPDPSSETGYVVKLRHLQKKDETEIRQSELVTTLKQKIDKSHSSVKAQLRRLVSSGDATAASHDSAVDVKVLTSHHKSKKVNRQNIIAEALASRRELTDSFVANAPIVAVETTDPVLQSIRTTRINNPESWRVMIQSAPQQEARYLHELQEQLKGWMEEGKQGAFVFNHRTRSCIFYDFGKAL